MAVRRGVNWLALARINLICPHQEASGGEKILGLCHSPVNVGPFLFLSSVSSSKSRLLGYGLGQEKAVRNGNQIELSN